MNRNDPLLGWSKDKSDDEFGFGNWTVEPIFKVFNLFNSRNLLRPEVTNLVFNFDGTVQSGVGGPRQMQLGVRVLF